MTVSTLQPVDFVSLGFHVSNAPAARMQRAHRHDEIEMTVLETGWIDYLFGGQRIRNLAGMFCVRWAAIPHQSIDFSPGGIHYSLKVPLAWFLTWQLPAPLTERLLAGEMLMTQESDPECSDTAMMRRWHTAFLAGSADHQRLILLEAQARLLRLAVSLDQIHPPHSIATASQQLGPFEKMTVFIAANYTSDISASDVAACAGLHPNSAMRLFRRTSGLTILEYVTMHRIRHAQHLLVTSSLKIREISRAAGFNSPNRFYAAFHSIVGQLPTSWRTSQH